MRRFASLTYVYLLHVRLQAAAAHHQSGNFRCADSRAKRSKCELGRRLEQFGQLQRIAANLLNGCQQKAVKRGLKGRAKRETLQKSDEIAAVEREPQAWNC